MSLIGFRSYLIGVFVMKLGSFVVGCGGGGANRLVTAGGDFGSVIYREVSRQITVPTDCYIHLVVLLS